MDVRRAADVMSAEGPAVRPERPGDVWGRMRRHDVLRHAYAGAARHLIGLVVPGLLVFLPLGLIAVSALVVIVDVDGSAAVVNGAFELVGSPGAPVLVWSAVVSAATVAAQMVVLPATVVLAAGRLAGEYVPVSAAMRAALRRRPAMLALVLVGAVVLAADTAAGLGLLLWNGAQVTAYGVTVFLLLFSLPCLLAVPGVVLKGRSARSALALAYRLTSDAPWATALTLAFGVVIFPALAQQAVNVATSGTPILRIGLGWALALVAVPFQATVIARLFLHRLAVAGMTIEFKEVVGGLPAGTPRPVRPVPVLAALLLPALLYGAAALVNPLGWLEVSETAVTKNVDLSEPRALYLGQDGRMVMLMDGSREAKLLTCADSGCARPRLTWAEPAAVGGEPTAVSARLADGRLAVATWAVEGRHPWVYDENWRARLRLRICDAANCAPAPGGKPLAEMTWRDRKRVVALAARPGGGLVVAQLHGIPEDSDADEEALSLTTCDDPACAHPRVKEVAKVPANGPRALVADVDPDDRPVMLHLDQDSGAVHVVSCDDLACARARVEQPVEGDASAYLFGGRDRPQAVMVVRADGRPLIAYQDMADGTIKLLDCRDRACSRAASAALTAPGDRHAGPAMALDRAGRALVAFRDLDRDRIVIAACAETRCTRTPVTAITRGGGLGLAMALDGRGRPVLAWLDFGDVDDWDLVVTTPLNLSARAIPGESAVWTAPSGPGRGRR
ncbi:hypothetical protein ACWCOT_15655 [Nonomuraea bangladeshensis]